MGNFAPFFFLLPTEAGEGTQGGGARGRRPWGLGGAREGGENGEGGAGNRFPPSPCAEAARGGGAMKAGGGGQRRLWRRRCKAGEGAGGGERGCGGRGLCRAPIYRGGDTGRREGADGWRPASSAAPSMVWGRFGGAEATLGGGV